ncbi:MAG: hypothetical protein AAFR44_05790 [Pseudomonadota bacterium]
MELIAATDGVIAVPMAMTASIALLPLLLAVLAGGGRETVLVTAMGVVLTALMLV